MLKVLGLWQPKTQSVFEHPAANKASCIDLPRKSKQKRKIKPDGIFIFS